MIISLPWLREKIPHYLREYNGSSFEQTWTKDKLCKFCWFSPVVLKKNIKFCQCIVAISLLSPLAKNVGPSFEQIWVLITQGFIVRSLVEIGQVVREKIFLTSSMHFRYVVIIYLWKRAGPFVWIKLNPL